MTLYPLLFRNRFKMKVWAGSDIKPLKGMNADQALIGESWEVSAVDTTPSIIDNGPLAGKTLIQAQREYGAQLIGTRVAEKFGNAFPLLIKFISTAQDLSIQVHPNDHLAQLRHGCQGKSEMWYIIDCKPGACIYSGFSQKITPQELEQHIADGTITDVLQKHEVHPGDAFYIPAGRIHAICSDILLAEIQENSDITYRIYDYGRMGLYGTPRELHTDMAKDAINYDDMQSHAKHVDTVNGEHTPIMENAYFRVGTIATDRVYEVNRTETDTFTIYMCLKGNCRIRVTDATDSQSCVELRRGHSCLMPASITSYVIEPLDEGENLHLLTAEY